MAPVGKHRDSPSFNKNGGKEKAPAGLIRKQPRRWDRGSLKEGQGFAIWRKQKIQRDYKKLLKKERNVNPQRNVGYTEDYPEHLKHLYLAEEEMLQKQQKPKYKPVVLEEKEMVTSEEWSSDLHFTGGPHRRSGPARRSKYQSMGGLAATLSRSNVIQRKCKAKTSNQKAKEDYEKIKIERDKKKEAAKKRREEREQAQKLYKQKKMETYKILSKRTRKGQPNLNLQMEYLLQKIEQKA
ncbi:thyroid transcription factor 1-associated protein 26 isoform X1 [Crotalus tigris]|uniref:thyroid transcription factor 1-associated protein 26 isoform X1 n=1 Tax=Crotalus tigris TaxID=88082 RepID=UPI00192FADAF|nr:thyroid transcription factor 1-associated protein 26 isoform X1 [Crotalus tigris]